MATRAGQKLLLLLGFPVLVVFSFLLLSLFILVGTRVVNDAEKLRLEVVSGTYSLECDQLYWLTLTEGVDSSGSFGNAVASSPVPLEGFCGRPVKIEAQVRRFYAQPLCREVEDSSWCDSLKIPVVDISAISAVES